MGGRDTKQIRVYEGDWRELYRLKDPEDSYADFVHSLLEYYKWRHPALSGEPPEEFEENG